MDNEEAKILVGENVPFITGAQSRQGDGDPFQTIQRQDIGVALKIKAPYQQQRLSDPRDRANR